MNWLLETAEGLRPLATGDAAAPTVGVIPGDDVALHRLLLVETSTAGRLEEARMRAVDLAAQPVDDLHVAVGPPDAEGGSFIAIIDRLRMQAHVEHFHAAGALPAQITVAPLLLQENSAARLGALLLFRDQRMAGALESGLAAQIAPELYRHPGTLPAFGPHIGADTSVPLNLLQGEFAPRRRWWKEKRFRIITAGLVLLAMLLALAPLLIERARTAVSIRGFDTATVEMARQTLGTAAPQEADAAAAALAAARAKAEGPAVGARLSWVTREIDAVPAARLGGVTLEGGNSLSVELGGPAEAINTVAPRITSGPFTTEREGTTLNMGERRAGVVKSASPYSEALLRMVAARSDAALIATAKARPRVADAATLAQRTQALLLAAGLTEAVSAPTATGVAVTIPAARSQALLPLLADIELLGARFVALSIQPNTDGTLNASFGATP